MITHAEVFALAFQLEDSHGKDARLTAILERYLAERARVRGVEEDLRRSCLALAHSGEITRALTRENTKLYIVIAVLSIAFIVMAGVTLL